MMAVRPGRVLKRETAARDVSAKALASALRTPSGRITDILNGKRGVSPETAMRLAGYFGNSAQFWLNLQIAHELALADRAPGGKLAAAVSPATQASAVPLTSARRRRTAARRSCASGGLCRGS